MSWLEEAGDIASQVSRIVHRKYHTYFDVADVRQELMVWIVRREKKVKQWLDHTVNEEQYRGGVKQLGKTLTRHADRYCRKRKAQSLGYQIDDEAYYSPISLSELLPFVWADVVNTTDSTKPRVSGGGNPAEGGNYVISLMDIRRAMDRLTPDDLMILEMIFHQAYTLAEAAHSLGVSESTIHRRKTGALKRMMNFLGGDNPFEYRRRMSNAQAQAVLE